MSMVHTHSRAGLALAGAALFVLTACSSSSAQQAKPPAPDDVVATVGARKITLAEVDTTAMAQPAGNFGAMKLSQAIYEARRAALEEIVGDALIQQEAKARGVETTALVDSEITAHVTAVSDADVNAWYQANSARVQGASLDQVRAPIRMLLTQERNQTARQDYLGKLKAKTAVRITLEPPRQTVSAAGRPTRGPAGAPIEMIEFSDFQCPFCLRAFPTVRQVLDTYGTRVRLVYRHFPLPNHPNARPAAEAAECAAVQGKFWEYHDRLFADQSKLSDGDLKKTAADIGLDATKFNACVDSHETRSAVEADVAAGTEAGINGTPAFFVNGRLISGSQPFDVFKRVIDEELELKTK